MKYELTPVRSNGGYTLLSPAHEKVASLSFPKWYKNEAHCIWGDKTVSIKPTNMWGSHFVATYQGEDIGQIKMNWKGDMQFSMHIGNLKGKVYQLKIVGMFSLALQLQTDEGTPLMHMKPTYKWKKWTYSYELSPTQPFLGEGPDEFILLALVCGFSVRIRMNSGVA